MMKKLIGQNKTLLWVFFIAGFIALGSSIPDSFIQGIDAIITRNFVWGNSDHRTATTADSLMGFINGSDTATRIPMPAGLANYWEQNNDSLYPATSTDNFWLFDSVYFSGLPTGQKDSILYWDNDTIFKGEAPSGGAGDTSYFNLSSSNNAIITKSGIDSIGVGANGIYLADIGSNYATLNAGPGQTLLLRNGTANNYVDFLDNQYTRFGVNTNAPYLRSGQIQTAYPFICVGGGNDGFGFNNTTTKNPVIVSNGISKLCATDLGIGIGTDLPDSNLTVIGGGNFSTDILVGGGWTDYTPTITFTGGTLSTPPQVVARYSVTNNTVEFNIFMRGENDSGSALTKIEITPPIYPPDVNAYCNIDLTISDSQTPTVSTRYAALLDMNDATEANRTIETYTNFNIANSADYSFVITGTYEITGR